MIKRNEEPWHDWLMSCTESSASLRSGASAYMPCSRDGCRSAIGILTVMFPGQGRSGPTTEHRKRQEARTARVVEQIIVHFSRYPQRIYTCFLSFTYFTLILYARTWLTGCLKTGKNVRDGCDRYGQNWRTQVNKKRNAFSVLHPSMHPITDDWWRNDISFRKKYLKWSVIFCNWAF